MSRSLVDKKYSVHSIFLTVQGEGFNAGRLAVFCRFSGCNVWSGLDQHRQRDAANSKCALICDTEFFGHDMAKGGGLYDTDSLVDTLIAKWPGGGQPFVVFTGGEPALQLQPRLVQALKYKSVFTAVETNGSEPLNCEPDWVTLSPKPPQNVLVRRYDELKVLYPLFDPLAFTHHSSRRYIQPVDNRLAEASWKSTVEDCMAFLKAHPDWRISVQGHKLLGVD